MSETGRLTVEDGVVATQSLSFSVQQQELKPTVLHFTTKRRQNSTTEEAFGPFTFLEPLGFHLP